MIGKAFKDFKNSLSTSSVLKFSIIAATAPLLIIGAAIGSMLIEDGYVDTPNLQANSRMNRLSESIVKDINDPEISARAVRGTIILEGYAFDQQEKERAELLAKTYIKDYIPLVPRHVSVINLIKLKEFQKWGAL